MDFRRQIAFALVASTAIEAMHWSGMMAATPYVVALPGYSGPFIPNTNPPLIDISRLPASTIPHGLAISVILVGFITCMLSYVLLARSVTQSRDELVSAIHTKRALWRVMAEKEAAIQADKQKTEFIAVASHEIRVSRRGSGRANLVLTACHPFIRLFG
jgi:signal transduction histidine kinase